MQYIQEFRSIRDQTGDAEGWISGHVTSYRRYIPLMREAVRLAEQNILILGNGFKQSKNAVALKLQLGVNIYHIGPECYFSKSSREYHFRKTKPSLDHSFLLVDRTILITHNRRSDSMRYLIDDVEAVETAAAKFKQLWSGMN